MTSRGIHLVSALSISAMALGQPTERKPPQPDASGGVLAMIGDRPITDAQLEDLAGERLARVKAEEYTIKRQVLDEYILQALMEKEAKARNISVEELRKREIDQKVAPVTEDAKRAVYESNPQPFQGKSEAEALAQIESNLLRIRLQEARKRFTDSMKQTSAVRIFYSAPRVAVDTRNEPSKGLETAPVTLVAFSDYQCPYCSRIEPTFKQLEKKYGKRLRMVYRDFPLSQIHPNAIKAAEAAECAKDQGKFWEMHDRLFSNQQALAPADLKTSASGLGLDVARFGECLDSGVKAAEWQRDLRDGQRYGVSGTPTVFINGRLIRGASTLESMSAIVDEELQAQGGSR